MSDPLRKGLISQVTGRYFLIALLAVCGAGFSGLDLVSLDPARRVFAEESGSKKNTTGKTRKKSRKTDDGEPVEVKAEPMFLQETEKSATFLPDIYRCPECGYEQDEEGFCPDHTAIALVKVLSAGRDPLAPAELDGNEDIIVDIPLKNIEFRKEAVLETATDTGQL